MPLASETVRQITALRDRYPQPRSAILPCLWAVQNEIGYLSPEGMEEVASILDLAPSEVQAVSTFYSMYFDHPAGEHQLIICVNVSCALRGADAIVEHVEQRLGCPSGGTTDDGVFTWESTVECLGACGGAPAMQVDHHFQENLTPERVDAHPREFARQARTRRGKWACASAAAQRRRGGTAQRAASACGGDAALTTGEGPPADSWDGGAAGGRYGADRRAHRDAGVADRGQREAPGESQRTAQATAARPERSVGSRGHGRTQAAHPGLRHRGPADARRLPAPRRLRGPARGFPSLHAREPHRRGQDQRAAGPRWRRLPHRHQVGVPSQGCLPALPLLQRRRVRAGLLQGPAADRREPPPAHRGAADRRLCAAGEHRVHLHPRRVPRPAPPARALRRRSTRRRPDRR